MFIEATAGVHISSYAYELVENAKNYNMPIQGKFNDIDLVAYPGSSVREIQYLYDLKMERLKNR